MVKSKGKKNRTRDKLRKRVRDKGKVSIQRVIQDLKPGSKVEISIDSSVALGQPNPKFHGKTGDIHDIQGRSYVVSVRDGDKIKKVISRPEHLKLVEA